jgi:hypothetical protein
MPACRGARAGRVGGVVALAGVGGSVRVAGMGGFAGGGEAAQSGDQEGQRRRAVQLARPYRLRARPPRSRLRRRPAAEPRARPAPPNEAGGRGGSRSDPRKAGRPVERACGNGHSLWRWADHCATLRRPAWRGSGSTLPAAPFALCPSCQPLFAPDFWIAIESHAESKLGCICRVMI